MAQSWRRPTICAPRADSSPAMWARDRCTPPVMTAPLMMRSLPTSAPRALKASSAETICIFSASIAFTVMPRRRTDALDDGAAQHPDAFSHGPVAVDGDAGALIWQSSHSMPPLMRAPAKRTSPAILPERRIHGPPSRRPSARIAVLPGFSTEVPSMASASPMEAPRRRTMPFTVLLVRKKARLEVRAVGLDGARHRTLVKRDALQAGIAQVQRGVLRAGGHEAAAQEDERLVDRAALEVELAFDRRVVDADADGRNALVGVGADGQIAHHGGADRLPG